MRERFERQLQELNDKLKIMGELIEVAIEESAEALVKGDVELAKAAIKAESRVDDMERDIERLCLTLLLHQHPVAGDLRNVSAALKMITDLERIGDQASDIAEIVISMGGQTNINPPEHLASMAQTAISMVKLSVEAYIHKDEAMALDVMKMDDIMDDYFVITRKEIVEEIMRDKASADKLLDLFMVTKYFERIGDHAENLAEWVEYAITGVHRSAVEIIHPELLDK